MSATDPLEHNLRQLLRRAYVPVVPEEGYRRQLEQRLVRLVSARTEPALRSGPRRPQRHALLAAAAAVLLLALGVFVGRGLGPTGPPELEQLLVRGEVALRDGSAGSWRGAGAASSATFDGGQLEVATPPERGFAIELAGEGRLELDALTHVRCSRDGGLELAVLAGRVQLVRAGETLALVAGASLTLGAEPAATDGGVDPALREPLGAVAEETGEGETQIADAPAEPGPPAPERARLVGRAVSAPGGPPAASFRLRLLRHLELGHYEDALIFEFGGPGERFELDDLAPGNYSIFAEAEGFAVTRLPRRELSPGDNAPVVLTLVAGVPLRGRVLDAGSGAPIPGAIVLSERDAPADTLPLAEELLAAGQVPFARSGADGSFELPRLAPGDHVIRATAAGHAAAWSARLPVEAEVPLAELVLELGRPGTIAGLVLDGAGRPLSGVPVVAASIDMTGRRLCQAFGLTTTDAEGRYAIEDLPPGFCAVVRFTDASATDVERIVQAGVRAGQVTEVDFGELRGAGAVVQGRALLADGTPLAASTICLVSADDSTALVDAEWQVGRTDAQGRFRFDELEPGTYGLYTGDGQSISTTDQELLRVEAGGFYERELRLPAGRLAGRVLDGAGVGVRAEVVLYALGRPTAQRVFCGKALTELDGSFALEYVEPGSYRLDAYPHSGELGQVASGLLVLAEAQALVGLELHAPPGGSIEVLVRDVAGLPVARAAVSLVELESGESYFLADPFTDSAGRFELRGLAVGPWRVGVSGPGGEGASAEVLVLAGSGERVEFELR